MWLSRRMSGGHDADSAAVARVTMGGAELGVFREAEERRIPVFSPGGYVWQPETGEELLVLRCGGETCAVGKETGEGPEGMLPGEVLIRSKGGASIFLRNDGTIEIEGDVTVRGSAAIEGGLFIHGVPVE
ncbi:MAG: hypothetical protein IK136_02420 [Oscillospiraceae bacterium]|nr:hypothetical protein [Oscillospiraceae bacterium]